MSPLINSANLDELLTMLGEDFRDIARLFVDQLGNEVGALHTARAQGDWRLLHRRAHALKGSSGNIGAVALAESAQRLEQAARTGDVDTIARELATIDRLAAETVQALRDGGYV